MENNKLVRFLMKKIAVEQFAILSDVYPSINSEIRYGTNISFKVDVANRLVACDSNFIFESDKSKLIKLEVQCLFLIEQTDWDSFKIDNKLIIPKGFLMHIAVHTVGTSRGILHCKTESTPFNCLIIPPINLEEIILDDFIVETEK